MRFNRNLSLGLTVTLFLFSILSVFGTNAPKRSDTKIIDINLDGVKMFFAEIPAGTFQMGQKEFTFSEPVHKVTISKPFFIGIHEVTQAQYKKITGKNPSEFRPEKQKISSSSPDIGTLPVESVSWFDAVRFCNALSASQGLIPCYKNQKNATKIADTDKVTCDWNATGYRLPTEAEWEYSCRSNTTTTYYWGNDSTEETVNQYAWYDQNSKGMTHPVGEKLKNSFGLYDMSGNVDEWCWDWSDYYPSDDQIDPKGPDSGKYRILRGGHFNKSEDAACSVARGHYYPNKPSDGSTGFRVVRLCP